MSIKKLTANVEVVQTLSTYPNQEDDLSPEELKAKFDEGAKVIKDFINEEIVPAINEIQEKDTPSGIDATDYYHTDREELGVGHDAINTAYVYSLYDNLPEEYVQMKELTSNDGTAVLREYIINCKTDGIYAMQFGHDDPARKPKYLIVSGIHGTERNAVFSTYRFIRDIVNGHNVPKAFKDGAILRVIPVANPAGFDAWTYTKPNGVSIDKNFDWEWQEGKAEAQALKDSGKGGKPEVYGDNAADQPETQAITKWLHDHSDAVAFINYHNNGVNNENVAIISRGDDAVERVKRAAMRGVDRVIPYWRDVIGYPDVEYPVKKIDNPEYATDKTVSKYKYETDKGHVIFSYTANGVTTASSFGYAINVVGIPSIVLETSCYYGDFHDWWRYDAPGENDTGYGRPSYQPEVIAMGAEAIGNILIELFSEASEVKDMAGVSNKLDTLMESVNKSLSFRVESDTLKITDVSKYYNGTNYTLGIPCSKGAKTIAVYPDDATLKAIYKSQSNQCFGSFVGNFFAPDSGLEGFSPEVQSGDRFVRGCSYMTVLKPHPTIANYWVLSAVDAYNNANNAPDSDEYGVTIPTPALLAGTYKWVAYYWDDVWMGGSY